MTWQWPQKPTPSIITEIISIDILTESIVRCLGHAKTMLNEALDQSVFYTDDIGFIVVDTDTGNEYTAHHSDYHGKSQLTICDVFGNALGWVNYEPLNTMAGFTTINKSFLKEFRPVEQPNKREGV